MTRLFAALLLLGAAATARAWDNGFGGWGTAQPRTAPPITSHPNVFGGQTFDQPGQPPITSHPNVFGGQTYDQPGRPSVTCRPNAFGGMTCN